MPIEPKSFRYAVDEATSVATLTLDRPDRLNALTFEIYEELRDTFVALSDEPGVRAVIITGAGRAFCSGGDVEDIIGALFDRDYSGLLRFTRLTGSLIVSIRRCSKPVVAALNGTVSGAGAVIAAACDIRIATTKARFMVAYIRVGLFPGFGGTWLYPRTLGSMGKAAELLFTGDFLEADEAYRLGFLNRLVEVEDLESTTMEMAKKIAAGPPVAMRLSKLMLYKGLEFDLETALKMAAAAETITITSRDHEEGTLAIREKRKPNYEGR